MKQINRIKVLLFAFSFMLFSSQINAQTTDASALLANDDFIYVDSSGAFGTMDSTLLDIISNLDSNYIFFDSLGNLVTTNDSLHLLLDSIDLINFGYDSTFYDIIHIVDSSGVFMTNDSILQLLLTDSSLISIDSLGNYTSLDTSLISIINGTFLPPDSTNTIFNILNQDSTYLNDSLLIHSDSLNLIDDNYFLNNSDSMFLGIDDGIFTVTETDSIFVDHESLNIFNSLNLFDIDSTGNITNSIFPEADLPADAPNPLLNKMIYKVGTEKLRAQHYGLNYAPNNSFYFGVSQLKLSEDSNIGVYCQGSISGTRTSDPSNDATNGYAPKIKLSLADMNVSPFYYFNVGGNKFITSAGIYASILIPDFKRGTQSTENNIGNSTGYGSHVMVGAIYDRLFLQFSGRFGKIANTKSNSSIFSNYNHRGFGASMDYFLRDHITLHLAYRYETFADNNNKTSSSLRLGMGIIF